MLANVENYIGNLWPQRFPFFTGLKGNAVKIGDSSRCCKPRLFCVGRMPCKKVRAFGTLTGHCAFTKNAWEGLKSGVSQKDLPLHDRSILQPAENGQVSLRVEYTGCFFTSSMPCLTASRISACCKIFNGHSRYPHRVLPIACNVFPADFMPWGHCCLFVPLYRENTNHLQTFIR